ncbi:hypothetical protein [Pseudomonas asplenii]|nr:hypothetical protein LOY63_14550 [Pseudomonas asplenii]
MLGASVEGLCCNYPIVGGDFDGVGIRGQVLAGGEDCFLLRPTLQAVRPACRRTAAR